MPLPKIKTGGNPDPRGTNADSQTGTKTDALDFGPRAGEAPKTGPLIATNLRDDAIAGLSDSLKATRRFWDKASSAFVEEPDFATRLRAIELVLAYAEGRPVERKVSLTGDFKDYNSKLEKLLATPEGLRVAIAAGLVEPLEKPVKTGRGTGSVSLRQSQQAEVDSQVADNQV